MTLPELFERYAACVTAGDVDAIVALYAEDGSCEIPVGGPVQRGIGAVRRYYTENELAESLELTGPVRVAGREAAAPMRARVRRDGALLAVDVIDVVAVNGDGLITSMRAFFDLEGSRPA